MMKDQIQKEAIEEIVELNLDKEADILKNDKLIQVLLDINKIGKLSVEIIQSEPLAFNYLLENAFILRKGNFIHLTSKGIYLLNLFGIKEYERITSEEKDRSQKQESILNYFELKKLSPSIFDQELFTIIKNHPELFVFDEDKKSVVVRVLLNCIPDLLDFLFKLRITFLTDWTLILYYQTRRQRKNYFVSKGNSFYFIYILLTDIVKKLYNKFNKSIKYSNQSRFFNLPYSKAELLGRIIYSDFDIAEDLCIDGYNKLVVLPNKVKEIVKKSEPKYSLILKLKRIGRDGKSFSLYKFRTFYPYSEFLTDYYYKTLKKFSYINQYRDFRYTRLGYILRSLWLDELPMFINLIKGEIKFVGVRPLSEHYLQLYSSELRILRSKFKPGLIPPYYADLPRTIDEIIDCEAKYLNAYTLKPIKTDLDYLFRSLKNIFLKGKRS